MTVARIQVNCETTVANGSSYEKPRTGLLGGRDLDGRPGKTRWRR